MRAADGPGELPAGLRGGCKMLMFHMLFFNRGFALCLRFGFALCLYTHACERASCMTSRRWLLDCRAHRQMHIHPEGLRPHAKCPIAEAAQGAGQATREGRRDEGRPVLRGDVVPITLSLWLAGVFPQDNALLQALVVWAW